MVGGDMQQAWEMLTGMPSRRISTRKNYYLKYIIDTADEGGHVMSANIYS